jgi:3-oxoacyl-(acyl-carrier-protein) synthase
MNVARLVAYSRVSPDGVFARGRDEISLRWLDLGAPADATATLRARWFFSQALPKFGRMDGLCKVALAAAQMLQRAGGFDGLVLDEVEQIGATHHGCATVDAAFEATREAGAPSPALFVYTLPSMFQGEIAIQFRLRGRCTMVAAGPWSGLRALALAVRRVTAGRAAAVLCVAAEAWHDRSAAFAALVSSRGQGPVLRAEGTQGQSLAEGSLGGGLAGLEALEALIRQGAVCTFKAGGQALSLGM